MTPTPVSAPPPAAEEASAGRPGWMTPVLVTLVAAVLMALVMAPVFHRLITEPGATLTGYNDFPRHVQAVDELDLSPMMVPPHFGFHLLTRAIVPVLGLARAAVAAASFSVALLVAAVALFARQRWSGRDGLGTWAAVGLGVFSVAAESPTMLFSSIGAADVGFVTVVLHTWANPTDGIAVGTAVLLMIAVLAAVEAVADPLVQAPPPSVLAVLGVVSMLAKPSFGVILIAALPLYVLWSGAWERTLVRRLGLYVLLPLVVTMSVQVVVLGVLVPPDIGRSQVAIAPFRVIGQQQIGSGGIWFWTALLVIPIAVWAGGRRYVRDAAVRLCLVGCPISVAGMLLVVEEGPRALDANFTRPAQLWSVLLMLATFRFLAVEARDQLGVGSGRPRAWMYAAASYAVLAVAGGAVIYLQGIGALGPPA